jgi:hypothetical protein
MDELRPEEVRIILRDFINAAQGGELELVERMVRVYGIDVNNQRDEIGGTAVHAAADCGQVEMLKLLRKLGADPKIKDRRGKLAVEYAIGPHRSDEAFHFLMDWTFPEP